MIPTLIGASILSFLLVLLPGKDPAEAIARRGDINASAELIEEIRVQMGLNENIVIRYLNWMKGLFTGDLGFSITTYRPIIEDIKAFLPTTLTMIIMALLWTILIAIPIALLCARYKDGILDHLTRGITIFGIGVPSFWVGFMLLMIFAINLKWFTVIPQSGLKQYILPSFTIAIPVICSVVRVFRATLLTQLANDYVCYAKARGLSPTRILLCHVFRNALPPIITVFCQYLGSLIAGSAVVEAVFSLKGIGAYLVSAVLASDATSTATCIVIVAVVFIVTNLVGDILNRIICPWMVSE